MDKIINNKKLIVRMTAQLNDKLEWQHGFFLEDDAITHELITKYGRTLTHSLAQTFANRGIIKPV